MASENETFHLKFCSNAGPRHFSFKINHRQIKWALLFASLSIVLLGFVIIDYSRTLPDRTTLAKTQREHQQWIRQLSEIESKVSSLETELSYVTKNAKRVNAIVKTSERLIKPLSSIPLNQFLESSDDNKDSAASFWITRFLSNLKSIAIFSHTANASVVGVQSLSERLESALAKTIETEQKHLAIIDLVEEQNFILQVTPSIKPTFGWYSSLFGKRLDPFDRHTAFHKGIDIAGPQGTPVLATADGVVKSVSNDEDGYGWLITIDHGYGVETRYGHVSKTFVRYKQKVNRGDIIAELGNTGRSTGPHLHYEVRIANQPVDPINYIIERN